MKPQVHLIVSLILSLIFYYFSHSIFAASFVLAAGFLIDLDHLPDYWLYRRRFVINKDFFTDYHMKLGRIFIVFHSIELWLVFIILLIGFGHYVIALAAILGFGLHIIMDFSTNGVHALGYFFVFRLLNGFRAERILSASRRKEK